MQINVSINDKKVLDLLSRIRSRMSDARPAFHTIGEIVCASIVRNFKAGGRPDKWEKSRRVKEHGGVTLSDTARLRRSFNVKAGRAHVVVGTSDKRAGTHHYGAEKGSFGAVIAQVKKHLRISASGKTMTVRAHSRTQKLPWGKIPARPFMMVQDEDWIEIRHALTDYLIKP
ncbi:MAG: hypothetical protein APR55_07095 [Methanolinea sp. SDB]|nr:MAG: hypothetical protein APR55_07095 [Methanolinea sp. SDB]